MVSRICPAVASTTISSTACAADGVQATGGASARQEPPVSSAMMHQVTSTGAVIGHRTHMEQAPAWTGAIRSWRDRQSRAVSAAARAATPIAATSSGTAPCHAAKASSPAVVAAMPQRLHASARAMLAAGPDRGCVFHRSIAKWQVPPARPTSSHSASRASNAHGRCIQRHALQHPTARPAISKGAVQKMPVPSRRSSQRPANIADKAGDHDRPPQHTRPARDSARTTVRPSRSAFAWRAARVRREARKCNSSEAVEARDTPSSCGPAWRS